ncbi:MULTISPECIES: winged helix-turn-helix domain-containing protein [unclassified Methylophilus]|jgi:molybdate transport system regulatory protein|uniref:winged helix-turn-helix domain-containing protein n=1 Tax=unclassified Methylophilus TaxID=2630143 RepID=UPI0006FBB723|nr:MULTISPECIES: LysR family transcriptional regulator [unclassified Methylophilus]KQT42136.1 ModE family transcriptional regulator [Methylophilus sp. Leaf416]KQT56317.1 ModE family transcriptional regulator [Methylophilus sp. Leaf459]
MRDSLLKIRISHEGNTALGPGKIELLQMIEQHGSISAAAKQMQMSYRRAWELVDVMNRCFDQVVVLSSTGGTHGGGAQVTEFGKSLIGAYQQILKKSAEAAADELDLITRHLKKA